MSAHEQERLDDAGRRTQWLDLLSRMCSGHLDDDQWQQLDAELQTSEACRALYADYMQLHVDLRTELAAVEPRIQSGPAVQGPPSADPAGELHTLPSGLDAELANGRSRSRWGFPFGWQAVAAMLLFSAVATASSLLTLAIVNSQASRPVASAPSGSSAEGQAASSELRGGVGSEREEAPDQPRFSAREVVAQITSTQNCRWGGKPDAGIGFGTRLYRGQRIALERGVAEITFEKGAKIVLEAPAEFEVSSPSDGVLRLGRLAAAVPPQASGFTIRTAGLRVVDLGNEFGVLAEDDGSEVHVFDGEVLADVLNASGQKVRQLRLVSDQAARLTRDSTSILQFAADNDEFIRTISPGEGPQNGLYASESFEYPLGPLAAMHGGFGWDGPWFNIRTATEGDQPTNLVAENSLQSPWVFCRGNRAVQNGQQNRIRRTLNTAVGGSFDRAGLVENQDGARLIGRDSTTVYLSFLQQIDNRDQTFYGFEVHRGDGNANRVLCIGNGADGCGYGVTSIYNQYGKRNFPALGEEDDQINFFVIRFTFGASNRDEVVVYRNPESVVDEDTCTADARLVGNFAFDRVGLGNFDGTKSHAIDEIRIGTKFRAVTGQRPPPGDAFPRPSVAMLW